MARAEESLEIHRAGDEERRRAYELSYETWGAGSRAAWVQDRMESRQHNRADWWVGVQDGEVVCSLASYPLLFQLEGELASGCGIGAVHTRPESRGEGYATALCRRAIEQAEEAGDRVALLFTDIDPDFYRPLGFSVAGRFQWRCDDLRALAGAVGRTTHAYPLDPAVDGERIRSLYDRAHAGESLFIERDSAYWEYLEALHADDSFVVVESGVGDALAYARLRGGESEGEVVAAELPFLADDPADKAAGLAGLAELLVDQGLHSLSFGVEPAGLGDSMFERSVRGEGIPMVAALGESFGFDPREGAQFWRTDKF